MSTTTTVSKLITNHLSHIDPSISIAAPDHLGVWVRGDGARYREFSYIHTTKFTDIVWDILLSLSPTKTLEVSGELGSDGFRPAVVLYGILFIKGSYRIEFGSTNRLKNTSVWRSRIHT